MRFPNVLNFLLFCCLLTSTYFAVPLWAQQHVYAFQHLTVEDGLTTGQFNYYIYQDRTGFVWISSDKGLNRFDGKNIRQYHSDKNNPHALTDEFASLSRFSEDSEGHLWFTNSGSLCQYRPATDDFQHHYFRSPQGDTVRSFYYWSYLDPRNQYIWVSGGRQLFAMNLADYNHKIWVDSLFVGLKDRMFSRPDSSLLLIQYGYGAKELTVHTIDDFQVQYREVFPHPLQAEINDIRYINDTLSFVATSAGLYQFNFKHGEWLPVDHEYNGSPVVEVAELAIQKNGKLLVATENDGIFVYSQLQNQYTGRFYNYEKSGIAPFTPNVVRMTLDHQDNLWIHAKDDGVYHTNLRKPKFNLEYALAPEGDRNIKSIAQAPDGSLWILLVNRVLHLQGVNITYYDLEELSGINLEQTTTIFVDRQNRVWAGTLSDLYLYTPDSKKFVKRNDLLPEDTPNPRPGFNDFYELDNGDILMAINNDCKGACRMLLVRADLSHSAWSTPGIVRAHHLAHGPDGTLAIATYIDSLHLGSFTYQGNLQIDTAVIDLPFISEIIYDTGRQHFWMATFNGLYRLYHKDRRWTWSKAPYTDPDLIINSMELTEDGELWLTVSGGLMRYRPEQKTAILYTPEDGLQGLDYNLSAVLRKGDTLYFGGTRGLNYFQPRHIRSTVPLARPVITEVRINRKPYAFAQLASNNSKRLPVLELPFHQNNIELTLAAREYSAPHRCEFRYQLLGSTNEAEVNHGSDPKLDFPSLNFGNYTLRIWASNSDGIWSDAIELPIHITPPWYRTGLFYTLFFLGLGGLFFFFYRRRVEKRFQEEQLKRQISEARQQLAETETAILRLQMDPHFIFNSMNSIDAYIMQGDRLTAHDYLVRFAELMRGILDNSENPMTSIEEEIELLQKYLEVEQMRVGPKMAYSFHIGEDVDAYDMEIPTMILQPFVENAIWHGIHPKEEGGHIKISFSGREDLLICEVSDDGVGRSSSNTPQKHRSKAIEITHKRLALLSKDASQPAQLTFIDHKDKQGNNTGTTVRISLPIIV